MDGTGTMVLQYDIKPSLVRKILYVAHVGKRPGTFKKPDAHAWHSHEMFYLDYGKMRFFYTLKHKA